MSKQKLSVEDFYQQFHGYEHHNDPGEYTKPKHHLRNPSLASKHKGLDLRALGNAKRKKGVVIHKNTGTMRLEMAMKKKAK
jgi:hypothetical protein